ncbi:hypothetical protein HELRODRAFT_143376, partial [Helobdella robusta]|uniref:Uncharacterized protein n=1 Tax=Helobdella robusta TaxID=6412 RepID=T1EJA4_HELRO
MAANCAKRDAFLRLNFIFQAAHTMLKQTPKNDNLIKFYGDLFKSISKKNVIKIHPEIKRQFCKKCSMLLIPGLSCSTRIQKLKKHKQKVQVVECLSCKTTKNFIVNPYHQLWI